MFTGLGFFVGLNIAYRFPASAEVTQMPIDEAWSWTNIWVGVALLFGPATSGYM